MMNSPSGAFSCRQNWTQAWPLRSASHEPHGAEEVAIVKVPTCDRPSQVNSPGSDCGGPGLDQSFESIQLAARPLEPSSSRPASRLPSAICLAETQRWLEELHT